MVVSNENMDSISGYNGETVPKEESDGARGDGTFTVPGLQVSLNSVVHSSTKSGESQVIISLMIMCMSYIHSYI